MKFIALPLHDRRLAALTLGEIGPAAEEAIPALFAAVDDEDESVAELAEAALEQIDVAEDEAEAASGQSHRRRKSPQAAIGLGLVTGTWWNHMDKLELVQAALRELGDVSAQELSAFIEKKHGVKIDPKYIPVFTASIQNKLRLEAARRAARATS